MRELRDLINYVWIWFCLTLCSLGLSSLAKPPYHLTVFIHAPQSSLQSNVYLLSLILCQDKLWRNTVYEAYKFGIASCNTLKKWVGRRYNMCDWYSNRRQFLWLRSTVACCWPVLIHTTDAVNYTLFWCNNACYRRNQFFLSNFTCRQTALRLTLHDKCQKYF